MSRFGNLEFGDDANQHRATLREAATDEAHFFQEAEAAFRNGKFETALRLYSKVLEFNLRNAAAWTGQVRMLIELGELGEARVWADKALEQFPHEPELHAAKAVALARAGDLQGAQAFSDSAMEERGESAYLWIARGDVLLAHEEARADYCFEKALMLAPKDWFVAWLVARVRCFYEQFAAALKQLEQAIEWNATHFLLWLEMGRCQQALGLVGAATASFSRARELNPQCDEARIALIRAANTRLLPRVRGWFRQLFKS